MKFAVLPMGPYHIGQIIQVHGKRMRVESYSHTGHSLVAHSLEDAPRFERVLVLLTDQEPLEALCA